MIVTIGSDHAGFLLKSQIVEHLRSLDISFIDVGTYSDEPVDYPDFAYQVAQGLVSKQAQRGIVICGSGVGASIAANKVKGIRACVCHDTYSAHQGVEHDDMNVLVLGARIIGASLALEVVEAFLSACFSKEERHVRRLNKILAIEEGRI